MERRKGRIPSSKGMTFSPPLAPSPWKFLGEQLLPLFLDQKHPSEQLHRMQSQDSNRKEMQHGMQES
jgi:hypothetical protein